MAQKRGSAGDDHLSEDTVEHDVDHRVTIDQDREQYDSYKPDDDVEESTDPSGDLLAKQHCTTSSRSCVMVNVEEFEKVEKDKVKWMDECDKYRKMIDKMRTDQTRISDQAVEYREKYLQVTSQLLDLQHEIAHQCKCEALEVLLEKARVEARHWEEEAKYWKLEYEAVLGHYNPT